jgi:cobaltochelatase CobT
MSTKASEADPIETFKRATVVMARTLSHEPEIDVVFSAEPPGIAKTRVRLPVPGRDLPPAERAFVRGSADAAALRLRHHDAKIFRRHAPAGDVSRLVYEAMEQARCEALGARAMPGIAQNLGAVLSERARRMGYEFASERAQVPVADVLRMLAREVFTGAPIPENARQAVGLWRGWIEKHVGLHLGDLPKLLDDQNAYAQEVRQLLKKMNMDFPGGPEEEEQSQEQDDKTGNPDAPQEDADDSEGGSQSEKQAGEDDALGMRETSQEAQSAEAEERPTSGDALSDQEEMADNPQPPASASGGALLTAYNAYTTQFDEISPADTLCPPEELSRLRLSLDNQVRHYQGIVSRLANRLQRKLLAQQNRAWDFDREEGMLDAARLARVIANPGVPLSFKIEKDTNFRDTVVSILIDNSGSMRGRPITIAAITADILARTLERCAVRTEILGFTTSAWKGGKSRDAWIKAGKPVHPGRLNDLRHIVYKAADAPWRRTRKNLGLMLREGLLKENIDGEALLWAHQRLLARPEERRILIVISDGAPVDDSTLSVNPSTYLEQHLKQAIAQVENASPVELLAIGIGHDVTRYYKRAVTLTDAEQLGGTVMAQLAELFDVKP